MPENKLNVLDLFSGIQSADFRSGSRRREASARSRFVRLIRIAGRCSGGTGRGCRFMRIFEMSKEKPGNPPTQTELMSSAAASPASPGPSPGSAAAIETTVTSGRRCFESLPRYGLDGSLGKMSRALLTRRWASTECFLIWKPKVTPHERLYWVLSPSTPRTAGKGSGLWPTATTEKGLYNKAGLSTKSGDGLATAAKQWATPAARDWRSCKRTKEGWDKRLADTRGIQLNDQTHQTSGEITNSPQGGDGLATAAKQWATPHCPRAHDSDNSKSTYLDRQISGETTNSSPGGALAPEFVEWVMGFPPGWTET